MPKHFYLATRKDRIADAKPLLDALRDQDWQRTYEWTNENENEGPARFTEIALAELNGVREADVLIVLLPGGYRTHVEIGAALALGKPVILLAANHEILETPYPCVFHYHPGVRLLISEVLNVEAVLACMQLVSKLVTT